MSLSLEHFADWAAYHTACYPGFAEFLNEKVETQNLWYEALENFGLAELKQASSDHYKRPNTAKQTAHTYQLADLLEILRANRQRTYTEQESAYYAKVCGLCRNHGMVDVVAKPGHEFPDGNGGTFARDRPLAVACKCPAGTKYRRREITDKDGKREVGFRDFDSQTMEPWNVWYSRHHPITEEMREAGKSTKATMEFVKRKFAEMGTKQPLTPSPAQPQPQD